ncbi:DUF928 domain-containing protein [Romeria aff. gracilis LEGE 07310]|uniref:DUF928 domain-containing protein n=1 Tax=Vasconcelosia minhoensis LEGE 07310 TaxID=915328 RepID=A0A8J7DBK6_9CYAN|nr:DUF928 domain-containing protein [Romeria gracilis]MBE9076538.1 DUF928 domain-containing protein [Romeria aff. gracilis LEGE 07310]
MSTPSLAEMRSNDTVRQGLPGRRISGGSRAPRAGCVSQPNQRLIALIPRSNLGLTATAQPTFWFDLPALDTAKQVEFNLFNQAEEQIYSQALIATGEAGVASITLPETQQLAPGETYRWSFSIICNTESSAANLAVTGFVQRVELTPELTDQVAEMSLQARLDLYDQAGIWYDGLTALIGLRSSQPWNTAIDARWQTLLQSIGLEHTVSASLVNSLFESNENQFSTPPKQSRLTLADYAAR